MFGPDFGTCSFSLRNWNLPAFKSNFRRLFEKSGDVPSNDVIIENFFRARNVKASIEQLKVLPGWPIAYWASKRTRSCFADLPALETLAKPRQGLATGDNDKYLRFWYEVSHSRTSLRGNAPAKWFPYSKGGEFRKWYGNDELVVNWENDGASIKSFTDSKGKLRSRPQNTNFYLREAVTWSLTSMRGFSARYRPQGAIFDINGMSAFPEANHKLYCSLLNSRTSSHFLSLINPTIAYQAGDIARIPTIIDKRAGALADRLVDIAKQDWNEHEISWDFSSLPLFDSSIFKRTLAETYSALAKHWASQIAETQRLETENHRLFIDAYELTNELTSEVSLSDVTLTCNSPYRYGSDLTDLEREARLKSDTMRELISYSVGCVMGRYSLSKRGLIYAHSGGVDFDPALYGLFPADEDGIIPITEDPWFEDDAAARIEEFLGVAWPEAPVMETLGTLTDGLTMGKGGEPRDALRGYLSKQFFKDHLQNYKNRPIYWLFSSGKQKAFEALVYLHRYNEGTLARIRTNYVTPLMGKLQQRISDLEAEVASSTSSAEKARKTKERDRLGKQLVELRGFDEELRHLADLRIAIDLDDGVKVNYAKFGNLLSGVDKICGKDN